MEEKEVFRVLLSWNGRQVLEFLDSHGESRYKDLMGIQNPYLLNTSLFPFLKLGLVDHHLEKLEVRKEWYELTEKGRTILEILRNMGKIMGTEEEVFFRLLSQSYTKEVLEFINERGKVRYKDCLTSFNSYTLNMRLRDLCSHKLVEHHIKNVDTRREWYQITEEGRKVVRAMKALREELDSTIFT